VYIFYGASSQYLLVSGRIVSKKAAFTEMLAKAQVSIFS